MSGLYGPGQRTRTVIGLGTAQTLAWGSTYYLPAILAPAMAADLGIAPAMVYGGLSLALVVAAVLGPLSGRWIDRHGGRRLLAATSLLFAMGLALLADAEGPMQHLAAWLVIGVGMGCGLYEGAFATLVRLYGGEARAAITGTALIAGFASTVSWPCTAWAEHALGWRGACVLWAGAHVLISLPIHLRLPIPGLPPPAERDADVAGKESAPAWAAVLLATTFAVTWFTSTAMASHLPHLLQMAGLGLAAAVGAAALVGPSQVAARVVEYACLRHLHPLLSARMAAAAHPLGAILLLLGGAPCGIAFAVLHGLGNGILTIAKGTLPLVIFGAQGYGARQGLLMLPARMAQAIAPVAFGLTLECWGVAALWMTAALGCIGLLALLLLHVRGGTRAASDQKSRR